MQTMKQCSVDDRVAIIGNGIAANLVAACVRKLVPGVTVTIIGPEDAKRPIVGESTVETSAHFLRELGLHHLLIEQQFPKYGLTYYYKEHLSNPNCRRYFVDEAPAVPPLPAFQLNRFTFDPALRGHNRKGGVEFIHGSVTSVTLRQRGGAHELEFDLAAGGSGRCRARWVVDASGRSRVLGKKLGLHRKNELQRSCFWFRLGGFSRNFLDGLQCTKKPNDSYNPYFATHHLFGRGNWIWCIPIRDPSGEPLISVGITFRPDLYPGDVRSVDEFLKQVGREHPAVVEMVHSGRILDTNVYRNYMYEASERYSGDGWFVLGDAADTVDPLYSSGLVTVALQSSQIAELVRRGLAGEDLGQLASLFDDAYACFHRVTTSEVTNLYPVMHDPYQCHLRQHLTVLAAFHLGVPMAANGYLACPDGARLFRLLAHPRAVAARMRGMHALIAEVAARTGPLTPETLVKVQSAASMNWQFMEYLRESDIPLSLASLLDQLLALRRELLRRLDMNVLARPRLALETVADLAQSAALSAARGRNLRRWKPAGLLARSLERIAPPVRPEAGLPLISS